MGKDRRTPDEILWDREVDSGFLRQLRELLKTIKRDCEVTDLYAVKAEVGSSVLDLIESTYGLVEFEQDKR